MRPFRPLLVLFLTFSLSSQTLSPTPAPTAPRVAKIVRKKGGKKKWIIIAAVTGGVVVGLLVLNARLKNEGRGL